MVYEDPVQDSPNEATDTKINSQKEKQPSLRMPPAPSTEPANNEIYNELDEE